MKEQMRHRLAFDLYLRMGASRSLEGLHEALTADPTLIGLARGPSRSTLDAWSSNMGWRDRLADLERAASEQDREEQVKALRDMNERHAKEGLALQQKAIERFKRMPADDLS